LYGAGLYVTGLMDVYLGRNISHLSREYEQTLDAKGDIDERLVLDETERVANFGSPTKSSSSSLGEILTVVVV